MSTLTTFRDANANRKTASKARRFTKGVQRKRDEPVALAVKPAVVCGRVTTLGDLLDRFFEQFDAARMP